MREYPLILICVDIRCCILFLYAAYTTLTPIAGEIFLSIWELLHSDQALIAAAVTTVRVCSDAESRKLISRQYIRMLLPRLLCILLCDYSCAIGAHQTCYIRPDHITIKELFHRAEHSIIVECTTLNDDIVAKLAYIFQLHDLEQRILNDR